MTPNDDLKTALIFFEEGLRALKRHLESPPRYANGHSSPMLHAQCATCGTVWVAPATMVGPEGYLDCCPNDPKGTIHNDLRSAMTIDEAVASQDEAETLESMAERAEEERERQHDAMRHGDLS